jgi:DNA-binding protein HU-beta
MKKEDLLKFVSEEAGIPRKSADGAIKAVFGGIASALEKGDSISLIGFGSFKIVERPAREGRNPRTGEKMQIPASKGVKFSPATALKERVNR